jgi:hypothetical protein
MAYVYRDDYDHVQPVVQQTPAVVRETPTVVNRGSSLTSYALVKYAFILAITIVILYFVARYLIPLAGR